MRRVVHRLPILLAMIAGFAHADDDDKGGKHAEQRLRNLESRARKIAAPAGAGEASTFLQHETQRLIERCRVLTPSSYEFARMLEAVDDLLDAREDMQEDARVNTDRTKEEKSRGDSAKRLERAYFRVQQGGYFAKLAADNHTSEYIRLSRRLYQQARAAYDAREYRRANSLASASSELINVLENLAQAAVRKPEPPELK
jgi:hypothetical protein